MNPDTERRRAFVAALRADEERIGPRVAGLVAKARAHTGMAPTWREVGRVMGWNHMWQWECALFFLKRQGWVTSTIEARSLRPGPRVTKVRQGSRPQRAGVK